VEIDRAHYLSRLAALVDVPLPQVWA